MAALNLCTVCGGNYRGVFPLHARTLRHRAAVNRRTKSNALGKDDMGTKAARRRAAYRQSRREKTLADYKAESVLVKPHRRSPPNDGDRKTVKVARYIRKRPELTYETVETPGGRYIATLFAKSRKPVVIREERDQHKRWGWL